MALMKKAKKKATCKVAFLRAPGRGCGVKLIFRHVFTYRHHSWISVVSHRVVAIVYNIYLVIYAVVSGYAGSDKLPGIPGCLK